MSNEQSSDFTFVLHIDEKATYVCIERNAWNGENTHRGCTAAGASNQDCTWEGKGLWKNFMLVLMGKSIFLTNLMLEEMIYSIHYLQNFVPLRLKYPLYLIKNIKILLDVIGSFYGYKNLCIVTILHCVHNGHMATGSLAIGNNENS